MIIHMLEAKVQRSLYMKGKISISQEEPKELDLTICEKRAIWGVVGLEEMGSNPKL